MTHIDKRTEHFYNMDIVRYILCSCVYLSHLYFLNGKDSIFPIGTFNVGFFALSGFLAYRTFSKAKSTKNYLKCRFCKLMTPYYIVIFSFAIILCGVISYNPIEYFLSLAWWKYIFFNILTLNFLCPVLPGVFCSDLFVESAVNSTLWTMKVELVLFLTFPIFMNLHIKYRKYTLPIILFIIISSLTYRILMSFLYSKTGNRMYDIMGRQFIGEFCFYYLGVLCYIYLDHIINNKWKIASVLIALIFIKYRIWDFPASNPIVITGCSLWLSIATGNLFTIKIKHNISYFIYLCHCPIIQLFIYSNIRTSLNMYIYFGITTLIVILISYMIYITNKKIIKAEKLSFLYK